MTIDSLRIVLNSLKAKGLLVGSLTPDLALWALLQGMEDGNLPELSAILASKGDSANV